VSRRRWEGNDNENLGQIICDVEYLHVPQDGHSIMNLQIPLIKIGKFIEYMSD
jgi:hypothetical protein